MKTADVDESALRRAWLRHTRASWPATFEACMADPIISRLIKLCATHEPTVFERPRSTRKYYPGVDRKRLAGGDKDE